MVLRLVVRQRAVVAIPAVLPCTSLVASPVVHFLSCGSPSSLLAATQDFQQVAAASTLEALKWLCKNEFIRSAEPL